MNSLTVFALAFELDEALSGAGLAGIRRFPDCATLVLDRAPFRYMHVLFYRREAELFVSDQEIAPEKDGVEEMDIASGRLIVGVHALGLERVLLAKLGPGGEWGAKGGLILRLDLTPAAKPLALYEERSGRPLLAIGGARARRAPGPNDVLSPKPYSLLDLPGEPPADLAVESAHAGVPPSAPEHTRRWSAVRSRAAALARSIAGVDPALAAALTRHAGGDLAKLWQPLRTIAERIAERRWKWHLYEFPDAGETGMGVLYPIELPVQECGASMKDYREALHARAKTTCVPSYAAHLRRKAAARLEKDLKRLERLARNLEADLIDAERSAEYRHYGDLLVTHRHKLKTGMEEITVRDFSGERTVTIPLDPALSPDRNIRRYFRRAKKGEKGSDIIRARTHEMEREITRHRKALAHLEALRNPAELIPLVPREKAGRAAEREAGPWRRFRRFDIDSKHTAYVGKSDADNDILTHDFASPRDLWLHAQGAPGSHVILKGYHRSTPGSVIERAAAIAAYYSKARNSSTVPVIYAEKRYVRRPRKSKPGTALCDHGTTIFVKPKLPDEAK